MTSKPFPEKQTKSPDKIGVKEKTGAKHKQSTGGMTIQESSSSSDLDPFVTFAQEAHKEKPEKYPNIDDEARALRKLHSELLRQMANTVIDAYSPHDRERFLREMRENSEKIKETITAIQEFLKSSTRLADEYKQNHTALCITEIQDRQDQELAEQAKNLGFGDAYNSSNRHPTKLDLVKVPRMKEYLANKQNEQEKVSKALTKLKKDLSVCANNAQVNYKYAKKVQESDTKQKK